MDVRITYQYSHKADISISIPEESSPKDISDLAFAAARKDAPDGAVVTVVQWTQGNRFGGSAR